MQDFNLIEQLWSNHSVEVKISSEEMLLQAKREVNTLKKRSRLNILLMLATVVALSALWWIYDFSSIITDIGIGITILTVLVYAVVLYNSHRLIANADFTVEPQVYLEKLKKYQQNRYRLYNSVFWLYLFLLTLGTSLYFIEILAYLSPEWQWIAITLTFGWIIFCSTVVRKAVIKREKERISSLIQKFERLSQQFHPSSETV